MCTSLPWREAEGRGVPSRDPTPVADLGRVDQVALRVGSGLDVIVPTAQNQINIENDLKDYFNENLDRDEVTLRVNAESIIRAYDPCMSCATNFLKMDLIRR
jgi:hypothetical protein